MNPVVRTYEFNRLDPFGYVRVGVSYGPNEGGGGIIPPSFSRHYLNALARAIFHSIYRKGNDK